MTNNARSLLFVLLYSIWAAVAHADRKINIKVTLRGGCTEADVFGIVIDGDETGLMQPPWTEPWIDTREAKFPDENKLLFASLRLKTGRRTYCRYAREERDDAGTRRPVAAFTFYCDEEPTRTVKVDAEMIRGKVAVSYVRWTAKDPVIHDNRDCDCTEHGSKSRAATIHNIRFPTEPVILQLGLPKPNPDAQGLLVLATETDAHALLPPEAAEVSLDHDEIAGRLFLKRFRATGELSVAARNIDDETLKNLKSVKLAEVK